MPPLHQLALPLPQQYRNPECARGDYTVFSNTNTECVIPAPVEQYLTDLLDFLASTKLIQRHPDDFFDYFGCFATECALHLDGTAIKKEEKENLNELCASFHSLLESRNAETHLPNLVKNGPPPSLTKIHDFFQTTRHLQLYRQRHLSNNGVSLTTKTENELPLSENGGSPLSEKQLQKLDLVTSHGMNKKKKHEVEIMCHTVNDLVQSCSLTLNGCTDETCLNTVINIGEGKGYVSRGLSIVCGLQVIGLDCNPSHKTKMTERRDLLLQASVNRCKRKRFNGTSAFCPSTNLLYEPRGNLTSIACKVEQSVDWAALLRGFVLTVDSTGRRRSTEKELLAPLDKEDEDSCMETVVKTNNMEHKMRCKLCARIVRNAAYLLSRHAHDHVKRGEVLPDKELSLKEVEEWNKNLGPDAFIRKLIESFFDPVDSSTSSPHVGWKSFLEHQAQEKDVALSLTPVYISRGCRVEFLCSSALFDREDDEKQAIKDGIEGFCSIPYEVSNHNSNIVRTIGTVLGYDDASKMHTLMTGNEHGLVRIILAQTQEGVKLDDFNMEDGYHKVLSTLPLGVVVNVFPFVAPTRSYVDVPLLRNTIMIGLHTCGDLGSNICRIFLDSCSRGLLLVSCCWHALTEDGFPLSTYFRSRGASINKVSLLLATQPFDMWGDSDSKGHQASAKLLFFRSVLKLLWNQLKMKWEEELSSNGSTCCAFAPLPHLEPYFLRSMAAKKHHINFTNFFSGVLKYFIFENTMRKTAYTWDNYVCTSCRSVQEQFFQREATLRIAKELEEKLYPTCFPSFLGLTVLRMWMCHTVESLFLLDRTLFLFERSYHSSGKSENIAVSLFPLFDGKISPRLFGICARRF